MRCCGSAEGQRSDRGGAPPIQRHLPPATELIADRGCDSAYFTARRALSSGRAALADRGIGAWIPSRRSRKHLIPHDTALYRQRYRIEIVFARLKDWRRIATRYDRCPHLFSPPLHSPRPSASGFLNES